MLIYELTSFIQFSFVCLFKFVFAYHQASLAFPFYSPGYKNTDIAVGFSAYLFTRKAETLGLLHNSKKLYQVSQDSLQAVAAACCPALHIPTPPGPSWGTAQGIIRGQNSARISDTYF